MHLADPPDSLSELAARRRNGWMLPAGIGAATALGTAAIVALDPGDGGTPVCISSSLLGIDCPLCGGLRCVNSLGRGDWLAAADHNVLLAVALPVAAVALVVWLVGSLLGRSVRAPRIATGWWLGGAAVLVAFTIARNLGTEGWLGWLAATG